MRRIALPTSVVVTSALSAVALGATAVITQNADFNNSNTETNVSIAGNAITVATVTNQNGDWYRTPYEGLEADGGLYGLELQKDNAGGLWVDDLCLDDSANQFTLDLEIIGTTAYRMGPFPNGGTPAKVLSNGSIMTFGGVEMTEIKFLTHGARGPNSTDDSVYTVIVNPGDADEIVFDVDILNASNATRAGSGTGTETSGGTPSGTWTTSSYGGFTSNGGTECGGDEGDEVVLGLPPGFVVNAIEFQFDDAADGTNPWLGGPFALSTDGLEADIESNFLYRASYESSDDINQAVSAGGNAIWYGVDWDATFVDDSDIFLRVRCGRNDQTAGNSTITNNEWKDSDSAGNTGPNVWQAYINLRTASPPISIDDCSGTHLQYQLEFYPEFSGADKPSIEELRFLNNPDFDVDGYPTENIAGHPQVDCDDTKNELNWEDRDGDGFNSCQAVDTDCEDDPAIDPNAANIHPGIVPDATDVGDGVDIDCDGREECFFDQDNDTYGVNDVRPELGTANLLCDQANETIAQPEGFDCEDTAPGAHPGRTADATDVGDGLDGDCVGGEECFRNQDGDGFGTAILVDENPGDGDVTCEPAEGEATQPGDCMDTGTGANTVFPGKTIGAADIDDDLDNNCSNNGVGDECWIDDDGDGQGNDDGLFVESPNDSCANTGESGNALDCLDSDEDVFDGALITLASQIDNGIDDNCSNNGAGDECWLDNDEDGQGNDDGAFIDSPDKDCTNAPKEALRAENTDCLDSNPAVFLGAPITLRSQIDNDIDDNCSNGGAGDECWLDDDEDGQGNDDGAFIDSPDQSCTNGAKEAERDDDTDCLDSNAAVFFGAPITLRTQIDNGIDDNCSSGGAGDECWLDDDEDGQGNDDGAFIDSPDQNCANGPKEALRNEDVDCLDSDPAVFNGAPITLRSQIDNNIDDNCSNNGAGDECWLDNDEDGQGNDDGTFVDSPDQDCTNAPKEARRNEDTDCVDSDADVFLGAAITLRSQIDNNVDDNCSDGGAGDECWLDDDEDGQGNDDGVFIDSPDQDCGNGVKEAELNEDVDCLDTNADVFQGAPIDASDIADDIDSNCSAGGAGDECWLDDDEDGQGNDDGAFIESPDKNCTNGPKEATTGQNTDCVDSDPTVFLGAPIDAGDIDNNVDDNCSSGGAGDECWLDDDEDGQGNDDGAFIDSSDTNCSNRPKEAAAGENTDCEDSLPDVFMGATIEAGDIDDDIDSNCSAGGAGDECWLDDDEDGQGNDDGTFIESPDKNCANGPKEAAAGENTDCEDGDNTVFFGASIDNGDILDGIDSNCSNAGNGDECWRDSDGDSFGNDLGTFIETSDNDCDDNNESLTFNDCNDTVGVGATVFPGNPIGQSDVGNGIDNDCDGADRDECWFDGDRDGFGNDNPMGVQDDGDNVCRASQQESTNTEDCNDGSVNFNPSVNDTCGGAFGGDGIDNNCDGAPFDDDNDGLSYAEEQAFNTDDCSLDSDGDGVPDDVEFNHVCGGGLVMSGDSRDSDGDGVEDGDELLEADTDSDGIKNPCDPDDDGDGIPTAIEVLLGNTDAAYSVSDTIPDYLDDDDDNDGIKTIDEHPLDFPDASGLPDYRNEDDDGDGLLTSYELGFTGLEDKDNDGEDNHRDLDSDGDSFNDDIEVGNFDGIDLPDFLDDDSDNDSVDDIDEFHGNTDGTGGDDRNDDDDDDDGLTTAYENSFSLPNPDGDALPNWRDLDSDNDGYNDDVEDSIGGANFDRADEPDFLDFDSDNDGVLDEFEFNGNTDGMQLQDRVDDDDDGDSVSTSDEIMGATAPPFPNFDGTGLPDYRDNDDDDDNIPTIEELPRNGELLDRDGDGPNYKDTDSDGDGILDEVEQSGEGSSPDIDFDYDNDGIRDFLDLDSDEDEVPDADELDEDTDAGNDTPDGSFNRNDDDDDGDGIPTKREFPRTLIETGGTPLANLPSPIFAADYDNDGAFNYLDTDSDGDMVSDRIEWTEAAQGTENPDSVNYKDSDGDNARDFLDLDSDNDTISDTAELAVDTDSDGDHNRVDDDDDGDSILTAIEFPRGDSFTSTAGHVDDDCGSTMPCVDYLDPDDDDDGYSTLAEAAFGNTDATYANPDNAPDYLDRDDDGDGLFSKDEPVLCSPGATPGPNRDNDQFDDYRDEDDDGDDLLTAYELSFSTNFDPDGDNDCNHRDEDSDGDGYPDTHEDTVAGPASNFDGVDLPDFLDLDSDNDGILDENEGAVGLDTDGRDLENRVDVDDDGDGILTFVEVNWHVLGTIAPDYLNNDDDGDGVPTLQELCFDAAGNCSSVFTNAADVPLVEAAALTAQNTDGDVLLDFLDTDDDEDSIPTIDEVGCNDPAGTPPITLDLDLDLAPNFLDADDDNDTIPTSIEAQHGGADADGDGCHNGYEVDSDDDTWPDRHEWDEAQVIANTRDFDNDGAFDFVDTDSDGDGVPDATELDPLMDDALYPAGIWDDATQSWTVLPPNLDGDQYEDRLDVDDDEDGIPTRLELYACDLGDDGSSMAASVIDDMELRDTTGGNCVEGTGTDASEYDWDGDAFWNYLDADDDNDNVPTRLEDYDYTYVYGIEDHDLDAQQFTDDAALIDPGLQVEIDPLLSTDPVELGDPGVNPDDALYTQNDTDGDGSPDFLDVDDDGDGMATILEDWASPGMPFNTNTNIQASQDSLVSPYILAAGDNLPDFRDPDDDGDGILTANEDLDGDGDPRTDNSNAEPAVPTAELREACPDDLRAIAIGCFDDTPDYLDVDDEGDGVPTWAEIALGELTGTRSEPYDSDTDGDFVLDGREWINFLRLPSTTDPLTVTIDEFVGIDVDPVACALTPQGIASNSDANTDGYPDPREGRTWTKPWDRDCDGIPNVLDTDDDNDGFLTNDSGDNTNDQDCIGALAIAFGDGIPNYLDIDSDDQTIIVSASIGDPRCAPGSARVTVDTTGDTIPDSCALRTDTEEFDATGQFDDADGDDQIDAFDCIETGPNGDDDGDKIANFIEDAMCDLNIQFRNDQALWPFDDCGDVGPLTRSECRASPDSDCDGVLDCEELSTDDLNLCDGDPLPLTLDPSNLRDSDNDGIPDVFDRDDDNDGIPTADELAFVCAGADDTVSPSDITVDLDSTDPTYSPWRWSCVNPAGELTSTLGATPSTRPSSLDTDAGFSAPFPINVDPTDDFPSLPNFIDPDDDGDGRLTIVEGIGDLDGDGLVNYLDPYDFDGPLADPDRDGIPSGVEETLGTSPYSDDTDGDGIPDNMEAPRDGGGGFIQVDTDGDGTPNVLDPDDDGDGIPSRIEGFGDQDRDGTPNYLDTDADGDGTPDESEIGPDGELLDTDCDGLTDFLDATDDSAVFCATGDTGVPVAPEGCEGCSSSGPSGLFGVLGVFALGLMRRRR